jgi:UDP-glucose 4-epimerase
MSRILVTGAAGFIGSHLCDALVAAGHDVVALDDMSSGRMENLRGCIDRVRFVRAPVSDLVRLAPDLGKLDAIIHLAAKISGKESLAEPDRYFEENVGGVLRAIDLARLSGAKRISFASSSTVYGALGIDADEDGPTEPITVYALSKLAGEHLLRMYAPLVGYHPVCLRLFNVYGPRQNPDHPYANVTCKFSRAAAGGEGAYLYGDGEQTRDFVFVEDVVRAFVAALGSMAGVLNVGAGRDHALLELVKILEELTGKPLPLERREPWPNDVRHVRAHIEALRSHGLEPRVSLREGLARTVAFFREAQQ